jgi:anti-sigma factor RsiW
MRTCEEVQEAISRYVDGELPASMESAVFEHAATCSECRGFLRSSMAIRAGLQADTTPRVPERLDRRIQGLRRRRSRVAALALLSDWWDTRLRLPLPAVAGAVVIVLAMSALLLRAMTAPPANARSSRSEYILTLEPVEVRGEPAHLRQDQKQF